MQCSSPAWEPSHTPQLCPAKPAQAALSPLLPGCSGFLKLLYILETTKAGATEKWTLLPAPLPSPPPPPAKADVTIAKLCKLGGIVKPKHKGRLVGAGVGHQQEALRKFRSRPRPLAFSPPPPGTNLNELLPGFLSLTLVSPISPPPSESLKFESAEIYG